MAIIRAADVIHRHIPHFNPVIANGIVSEQFKELEDYVKKIFREVGDAFPPSFKYLGWRRCTPEEEVAYILDNNQEKKKVELAESNVYLTCLSFEFQDTPFDQYLYLPYVRPGGQMYIRGVSLTITPVLTAPVFSVESMQRFIFMKFLTSKLTIKQQNYTIKQDGRDIVVGLTYSKIHRVDPKTLPHWQTKKDERVRIQHIFALYLFAKFGFTEAMKRYGHADAEIHNGDIDWTGKNPEEYHVFQGRDRRPTTVRQGDWSPHSVKIILKKEYLSDMTLGLIGGFFYITDAYRRYINDIEKPFDQPDFWKILLGKAIFLTNDAIGTLLSQVRIHMASNERMIDGFMLSDMQKIGLPITEFSDLLAYLVDNFSTLIYKEDKGSLYDKKLLVLRNVLEEIIKGINQIQFKASSKKDLTSQFVRGEIRRSLYTDRIFRLRKSRHFCKSVQSPSDCMAFNHTNKFLLQNNISTNNSASDLSPKDPSNHLHASVLEIGSYVAIKRSEYTGRQLLNPYQETTVSGITKRNPDIQDKIDYVTENIRRD